MKLAEMLGNNMKLQRCEHRIVKKKLVSIDSDRLGNKMTRINIMSKNERERTMSLMKKKPARAKNKMKNQYKQLKTKTKRNRIKQHDIFSLV
jgi:hypothetical protein